MRAVNGVSAGPCYVRRNWGKDLLETFPVIIDYHQGRVVVTPDGRDNCIVLVTGDGDAIEIFERAGRLESKPLQPRKDGTLSQLAREAAIRELLSQTTGQ